VNHHGVARTRAGGASFFGEHVMTPPSLSHPWVLIRYGDAPPALACLTSERWAGSFYGDLMVAETNRNTGLHEWRKRYDEDRPIAASEILHVFPCAPSPHHVAEARRALRRKRCSVLPAQQRSL
jgi:hypothetical protein